MCRSGSTMSTKRTGRLPESFPRDLFFHWVLLDIPATVREIPAGSHSDRITAKGKPGPAAPGGMRHGLNDYTKWFAGDKNMGGDYYGYDGPCPPWNDLRLHHYVFTLYALDVPQVEVHGDLTGANATARDCRPRARAGQSYRHVHPESAPTTSLIAISIGCP